MTDEQIKQNAEKYALKQSANGNNSEDYNLAKQDYLAGAHSRDEEIGLMQNALEIQSRILREMEKDIHKLRNPWISVNERLPEEFQIVFVHMQGGSCDSAIYTNGVFRRDLQLKFGMKDDGYTLISWQQMFKSNITHWMPIPEIKK